MSKLIQILMVTLAATSTISIIFSIRKMIGVDTEKEGLVLFCVASVIAGMAIGYSIAKVLER